MPGQNSWLLFQGILSPSPPGDQAQVRLWEAGKGSVPCAGQGEEQPSPAFQDPGTSRAELFRPVPSCSWLESGTVTGSRGLTDTELGQGQSSSPGKHGRDTGTSEASDPARVREGRERGGKRVQSFPSQSLPVAGHPCRGCRGHESQGTMCLSRLMAQRTGRRGLTLARLLALSVSPQKPLPRSPAPPPAALPSLPAAPRSSE